jgi:hypothetical protein
MVQLFVCRANDCYDEASVMMPDQRSWIVRIATVPLVPQPENAPHLVKARTKIEDDHGFLPAQLAETWTAGKDETWHWERMLGTDSKEFYALHEPELGLKLLGHSDRGRCSLLCTQSSKGLNRF